jgi:hypothetical protein
MLRDDDRPSAPSASQVCGKVSQVQVFVKMDHVVISNGRS